MESLPSLTTSSVVSLASGFTNSGIGIRLVIDEKHFCVDHPKMVLFLKVFLSWLVVLVDIDGARHGNESRCRNGCGEHQNSQNAG